MPTLCLKLKKRLNVIRKWPIVLVVIEVFVYEEEVVWFNCFWNCINSFNKRHLDG